MRYWFIVQKEYVTTKLITDSYQDRRKDCGDRHCLIDYSEKLRVISDTTINEEADYVLVPLNSYFHDDTLGLIAYSHDEIIAVLEQPNWLHNQ